MKRYCNVECRKKRAYKTVFTHWNSPITYQSGSICKVSLKYTQLYTLPHSCDIEQSCFLDDCRCGCVYFTSCTVKRMHYVTRIVFKTGDVYLIFTSFLSLFSLDKIIHFLQYRYVFNTYINMLVYKYYFENVVMLPCEIIWITLKCIPHP